MLGSLSNLLREEWTDITALQCSCTIATFLVMSQENVMGLNFWGCKGSNNIIQEYYVSCNSGCGSQCSQMWLNLAKASTRNFLSLQTMWIPVLKYEIWAHLAAFFATWAIYENYIWDHWSELERHPSCFPIGRHGASDYVKGIACFSTLFQIVR